MDTPDTELKKWFEENYLDGDKVQVGQMLSSSECLDALSSRDTYWKERVLAVIEEHDPSSDRETNPRYWGKTLREAIKSLR